MKRDFVWNSNSGSSKTKENKDNISNMMLGKYWPSGDILRKWCS